MFDNSHLVDLIERELDDHPHCPVCGAPTTIEEGEAGRLWLVCSAAVDPQGILARLGAALLPHERRLIVDWAEDLAA